jgi:hypothetical protein
MKVKVKFSLEQAMKAQRGSRGIALLCLKVNVKFKKHTNFEK